MRFSYRRRNDVVAAKSRVARPTHAGRAGACRIRTFSVRAGLPDDFQEARAARRVVAVHELVVAIEKILDAAGKTPVVVERVGRPQVENRVTGQRRSRDVGSAIGADDFSARAKALAEAAFEDRREFVLRTPQELLICRRVARVVPGVGRVQDPWAGVEIVRKLGAIDTGAREILRAEIGTGETDKVAHPRRIKVGVKALPGAGRELDAELRAARAFWIERRVARELAAISGRELLVERRAAKALAVARVYAREI